jgi:CheY-like chemotaxis protein
VEDADEPGTTIRVLLPRAGGPPPDEVAAAEAEVPAEPTRRGLVLVADDEGAVRSLVERVLRGAGYAVIAVADGREALDVAASRLHELDLLVSDAVMPGVTGLQLARRLRVERPDLPILFISGWASDAFDQEWRAETRVDLLLKPFSVGELLARVASLTGAAAIAG